MQKKILSTIAILSLSCGTWILIQEARRTGSLTIQFLALSLMVCLLFWSSAMVMKVLHPISVTRKVKAIRRIIFCKKFVVLTDHRTLPNTIDMIENMETVGDIRRYVTTAQKACDDAVSAVAQHHANMKEVDRIINSKAK